MDQACAPPQTTPQWRTSFVCFILACAVCFIVSTPARSQDELPASDEPLSVEDHSWANFAVGSWKRVRISKEVLDANGKVKSITIQDGKSTLVAVDGDRFTLLEEVTVEVAGKRFPPTSRTIERGLYNESDGQTVTVKPLAAGSVAINRHEYPSQIREITVADKRSVRVTKVHYSPDAMPFFLKRDTICTDPSGETKLYEAAVEVVALDMPHRVLAEIKTSALVKTVHLQGNLTTVTLEVCCADVPGHVVAHAATKENADGQLIERSTLELLEYEVASKQADVRGLGRTRFFGKWRFRGSPR